MAAPKKKSTKSTKPLTPDGIMQLGLGFWGFEDLVERD
jgi:hypothetical protein